MSGNRTIQSRDVLTVAPGEIDRHEFLVADLGAGNAVVGTPTVAVEPAGQLAYSNVRLNAAAYTATVESSLSTLSVPVAIGEAVWADFDASLAVAGSDYLIVVTVQFADGSTRVRYVEVQCREGRA
ncbi:MAG: hypothetical protein WBC44_04650 [Planctomycetaceae bacterium]